MAGIYDRVARTTASNERVAGNLLHAAFVLRAAGKFNDAQILAGLDAYITGRGGTALSGQELTDLGNMAAYMDAQPSTVQKILYAEVIRAAFITVELGLMGEIAFNSAVELSA